MRTPEAATARIDILDVLRGVALGGILVINAMSILAVKGSTPAFTVAIPPLERALQDAILFFVESKFFTLFSLLFGVSFAIQMDSAQRQGVAFLPRIARRLGALLVCGLAHVLLLWEGDILVIYALTGTVLVAARNITPRASTRWIIGLLAVPAALVFLAFVMSLALRVTPAGASALSASDREIVAMFADLSSSHAVAPSTFVQGAFERIGRYLEVLPLLLSRIPTVLAMFLLGHALGRSGFFDQLASQRAQLRRVRALALGFGLPLMLLIVVATKALATTSALLAIIEDQYVAGPLLSLGLAATLALDSLDTPSRPVFAWIRPMGQMALTNYLAQSLVLSFLAEGWGLGLATRLSGFHVLAACGALFATQGAVSRVWLRRFAYGPCEWAWRCVTYGRWMPLTRTTGGSR